MFIQLIFITLLLSFFILDLFTVIAFFALLGGMRLFDGRALPGMPDFLMGI